MDDGNIIIICNITATNAVNYICIGFIGRPRPYDCDVQPVYIKMFFFKTPPGLTGENFRFSSCPNTVTKSFNQVQVTPRALTRSTSGRSVICCHGYYLLFGHARWDMTSVEAEVEASVPFLPFLDCILRQCSQGCPDFSSAADILKDWRENPLLSPGEGMARKSRWEKWGLRWEMSGVYIRKIWLVSDMNGRHSSDLISLF